jgi:hypothetical protein
MKKKTDSINETNEYIAQRQTNDHALNGCIQNMHIISRRRILSA